MFGTLNKKSFGPFVGLDLVFVAFALIAVLLSIRHAREGAVAVEPLAAMPFVAILLGAVVVLSVLAVFTLRIDRKLNDEYTFQAMSNSAISAVLVTFVIDFALELSPLYAAERIHSSSDLTLAILAGSWASGYAIYRVRGTVL